MNETSQHHWKDIRTVAHLQERETTQEEIHGGVKLGISNNQQNDEDIPNHGNKVDK